MRNILVVICVLMAIGCERSKIYTVGIVNANPGLEPVIDGFKAGMAKRGYIDGKNIVYLYDGIQGNNEQIDAAIGRLIKRKVDILLSVTTPVTQRAKKLTEGTGIPVVFAPVFYAVEGGIVKSMTHPGGNLTGIQMGGNTEKALEWHKRVSPSSRNIFVPFKPDDNASVQSMADLKRAAGKLGVNLLTVDIHDPDGLRKALNNVPDEVDSIWLLNSFFFISHIKMFVQASLKYKIPLSSGTSQLDMGVMVTYGQKPYRTGEQASRLAHVILQGGKPSELPVETVDYFLGINLRMARAIGLNVPDDVVQEADEVIR